MTLYSHSHKSVPLGYFFLQYSAFRTRFILSQILANKAAIAMALHAFPLPLKVARKKSIHSCIRAETFVQLALCCGMIPLFIYFLSPAICYCCNNFAFCGKSLSFNCSERAPELLTATGAVETEAILAITCVNILPPP